MPVLLDTVGSFAETANVTSNNQNLTGTLTSAGANYVIVFIARLGNPNITAVSVGGTALARASGFSVPPTGGGYTGLDCWAGALSSPSAATINLQGSSTLGWSIHVLALSGVNTSSPFGTWVAPGDTQTLPTTCNPVGIDSNGLFLYFDTIYKSNNGSVAVVTDSGATLFQNAETANKSVAGRSLYATGAVSNIYTLTAVTNSTHSNTAGVYVNSGTSQATRVRRTRTFFPVFYPR
jgi:hypothetical protein